MSPEGRSATVPAAVAPVAQPSRWRSIMVVARLAIITQVRRRAATVLLTLLPIGFYMALRSQPFGGGIGGLATGSGWAMAFVSLFGFRTNAGIDARVCRLGQTAWSIFVGRLLAYAIIATVLSSALALFATVVDGHPFRVGFTAAVLAAVTAIPLGALIGVWVPGEVEGTFVILALYGIPFALPFDSPALKFTPQFGPLRYSYRLGVDAPASWYIHPIAIGVVATVVAALVWGRSTQRGNGLDAR